MGNLRFAAALLFVAACGSDHANNPDAAMPDSKSIDAKVWMDAPPPSYDFSCSTNPAPADGSASATITLSGTVTEVDINLATQMPSIMTLDGATLNACKAGATNCAGGNKFAGPATSAGGGNFSLGPISTVSNNPIDGYIAVTHNGDRNTYVFPPQKVAADLAMIPVFVFTTTAFGLLDAVAGGNQQQTNGNLVLAVTDCMNQPIDGATISVKQNGTAVSGITDFDLGMASSMAAGLHVVFNVPPGATEVNATINGMMLHAHSVDVFAGGSTMTIIRPGYL